MPNTRKPKKTEDPKPMYIEVEGRQFEFPDTESLTFGELKLIKKMFGEDFEDLGKLSMMLAHFVIAKVREDGDIDQDFLDNMKPLTEIKIITDQDLLVEADETPLGVVGVKEPVAAA